MSVVTGSFAYPHGVGQSRTPVEGKVIFTRRGKTTFADGWGLVPAEVCTPITGGVMAPVRLFPGGWGVQVLAGSSVHRLADAQVAGEVFHLTGPSNPTDTTPPEGGDYIIFNGTVTHAGDGAYFIEE